MRIIVGAYVALLIVSTASAQQPTRETLILLKAAEWRTCVVSSAEKAGIKSKQTPDDVVSAFIDDCGYPEMVALAKASFMERGLDEAWAMKGVSDLYRGERLSVAHDARQAVVKARVKAGL